MDRYRVFYVRTQGLLAFQVLILVVIATLISFLSLFVGTFFFLIFVVYLLVARSEFVELTRRDNDIIINRSAISKKNRVLKVNKTSIKTILYRKLSGEVELVLNTDETILIKTAFPTLPFVFSLVSKKKNILSFFKNHCIAPIQE